MFRNPPRHHSLVNGRNYLKVILRVGGGVGLLLLRRSHDDGLVGIGDDICSAFSTGGVVGGDGDGVHRLDGVDVVLGGGVGGKGREGTQQGGEGLADTEGRGVVRLVVREVDNVP